MIHAYRRIRRLSLGLLWITAGAAVGGASWVNPGAVAPPHAAASPPASAGSSRAPTASRSTPATLVSTPVATAPATDAAGTLAVADWRLGHVSRPSAGEAAPAQAAPGRPIYLSMTLTGGEAAVERLRREGHLRIQVHWHNQSGGGAPDLVTDLTVGNAGFVPTFEAQIRRKGAFEWHSWARKDRLSPGSWTVSVTDPDGQALPCGKTGAACRISFNIG
jgi:hypothetical protein